MKNQSHLIIPTADWQQIAKGGKEIKSDFLNVAQDILKKEETLFDQTSKFKII